MMSSTSSRPTEMIRSADASSSLPRQRQAGAWSNRAAPTYGSHQYSRFAAGANELAIDQAAGRFSVAFTPKENTN